MAELVFSAIQAGDIDMRPELYKHIGKKIVKLSMFWNLLYDGWSNINLFSLMNMLINL